MPKFSLTKVKIKDLDIEYSVSRAEPCMINILYINGILSSIFDFGTVKDIEPSVKKDFFGCMKRRFLPYSFITPDKLKKLNLTKEQVDLVNDFLAKTINRDKCNVCDK